MQSVSARMASLKCLMVLVLLVAASFVGEPAALAQSSDEPAATTQLPDPLTPEAVRELVSTLSDQEVRQLLLERLDAVARGEPLGSASEQSTFQAIGSIFYGIGNNLTEAIARLPNLAGGFQTAFTNFLDGRDISAAFLFVGLLIVTMVIGYAAERIGGMLTLRWRNLIDGTEPQGLMATIKLLCIRGLMDMGGVIVFALACYIAIQFLFTREQDRDVALLFILSYPVVIKALMALARFTVAPHRPDLRLLSVDDYYAGRMFNYMIVFGFMIGSMQFLIGGLEMLGIPMGQLRLGYWINLAMYLIAGYAIYDVRKGMTDIVIGNDGIMGESGHRVAHWWPYITIGLIVLNWMLIEAIAAAGRFDLLRGQQHITLILIVMAPAIDTALRGIVKHMTPPMIGEGTIAQRAHEATLRSYVRIGRILLVFLIVLLMGSMWNFSLMDVANQGVGAQLASSLIGAGTVLAFGYLFWELFNLWVNRRLAKEMTDAGMDMNGDEPGGGEGGGAGLSRLATVLPVMHLVGQTTILVITFLLALGQLGLDITPLLAGAGIVGLAVGFGAQSLVRDVVSGVFFLIEDAFRVGEYLVIDETVGTVEKISLRSVQLRHHEGPIHTIPYGEIPKVTNNSRDWVIMKLKFTFPFDTDSNRIKKIFKKVGQDMLEADYAEDLIQTFKSQGVYDVDDVGIVFRGKFMSKPGKQWVIRKDIYARLQRALDEAGIEFARKEVRVSIPGLEENGNLTDDQKQAVGAAAADAAEKMVEPAKG